MAPPGGSRPTYEVRGPGGEAGDNIIRRANGTYDVPGKAQRVGLAQAVAIALGREEPPPERRQLRPFIIDSGPVAGAPRTAGDSDLEAALAASIAQARKEPPENWELRQGGPDHAAPRPLPGRRGRADDERGDARPAQHQDQGAPAAAGEG